MQIEWSWRGLVKTGGYAMLKRWSEILKVAFQPPTHHRLYQTHVTAHCNRISSNVWVKVWAVWIPCRKGRLQCEKQSLGIKIWLPSHCWACWFSVSKQQAMIWRATHCCEFSPPPYFFFTFSVHLSCILHSSPHSCVNSSIPPLPTGSKQPPLRLQAVCTHLNVLPNGLPTYFKLSLVLLPSPCLLLRKLLPTRAPHAFWLFMEIVLGLMLAVYSWSSLSFQSLFLAAEACLALKRASAVGHYVKEEGILGKELEKWKYSYVP